VTLNEQLPEMLKQKLQNNSNFLATIQYMVDTSDKNYWSFPEYKEAQTLRTLDEQFSIKD